MFKPMTIPKGRILIVEDEETTASLMKYILESEGYEILVSKTPFYALSSFITFSPHIMILDIRLPCEGADGLDLFDAMKAHFDGVMEKMPVLVVSGIRDEATKQRALKLGVSGYLEKPFEPEDLVRKIYEIQMPGSPDLPANRPRREASQRVLSS